MIMEEKTLEMQISELILQELSKRCIYTTIEKCVVDWEKKRVHVETSKINTTPRIFKELRISDFGSSICEVIEGKTYEISINLDWRYEHWDGGHNGCHVVTFLFSYFKPSNKLYLKHEI